LKEKGKNGKVIVCAIMRKLVHLIFGILKRGSRLTRTLHHIVLDRENGIYKQILNESREVAYYHWKQRPHSIVF